MRKLKLTRFSAYPIWACFADGGGDPAGDDKKDNPPADNKDADGGGKKPDNDPPKDAAITFPDTGSFHARMEREAKNRLEAQAKELGFESYEAMQAAAKAAKEAEEKSKTELEKEKDRADKAEHEKKEALEKANTRLVNSELKVFAAQAGIVDPDAAVALANRSEIEVDDEGNVKGAKEAIEALAKEKPYLVGKPGNKSVGNPGSPGGDPDGMSEEEQGVKLAEERRKAKEQSSAGYDPWATK